MRPLFGIVTSATIAIAGLIPSIFSMSGLPVVVKSLFLVGCWTGSVLITYSQVYSPLFKIGINGENALFNLITDKLDVAYREYTGSRFELQIHVMSARRHPRRFWTRSLVTRYTYGKYQRDADGLEYCEGEGLCGRVLADNHPVWFDRESGHDQYIRMPKFGGALNQHVTSALAVPIYRQTDKDKTRPIGVLVLESGQSVEHSKFDDSRVWSLAMTSASLAGVVLH